jgi:hypothetical protein
MVEGRSRLGFTTKTFQRLGALRHVFGQELEGDETVQARVLRLVDDTHTATAELADDAAVRERCVDHRRSGDEWMSDDRANAVGSQFTLSSASVCEGSQTPRLPVISVTARCLPIPA